VGFTPGRFILGESVPGNHLTGGSVSSSIRVCNCHIPACSSVPMRLKYTVCYANSISQIIEVEHLVFLCEGTMDLTILNTHFI
jgi:hypothetical protein